MAAYIKELKNKNNDTVYPITDINAVVDNENQKTLKETLDTGAFGVGARAYGGGGAVGNSTTAHDGGAVGYKARTIAGGGAVGNSAVATYGGAVGNNAVASEGGAIGHQAHARDGGAVGYKAKTGDGFAGGANARCYDEQGAVYVDSIQLGTGNNKNPKTLQVYDYQLMDESGNIPVERLQKFKDHILSQQNIKSFKYDIRMGSWAIAKISNPNIGLRAEITVYHSRGTADVCGKAIIYYSPSADVGYAKLVDGYSTAPSTNPFSIGVGLEYTDQNYIFLSPSTVYVGHETIFYKVEGFNIETINPIFIPQLEGTTKAYTSIQNTLYTPTT